MGIKNWIKFFLINSLLGIVVSSVLGVVFEFMSKNSEVSMSEAVIVTGSYALIGFTISALAHMGYFFYQYFIGSLLIILRSRKKYYVFQIILTLISVLFSANYSFQYSINNNISIFKPILFLSILLIIAFVVSLYKVKLTTKDSFVPSICFLIFGTLIEGSISFGSDTWFWSTLVFGTLIVCNSYQLLYISKYLKNNQKKTA
ncbi:MAG: KinB-signaling pathway activation protein [Bacillales bacterium]|nr:KinB-signaling pathway activation protein [Bacillales bacterium]